ncbi:hypothetical protein T492DRAFT_835991 [Pavlovales sp. CCMP2436]|nr:hypothetical protein T492DRAFT_835991 [Pavlovales sp. CCMP2436]
MQFKKIKRQRILYVQVSTAREFTLGDGVIVKALSSASSGLRRNLQAVQLHARHARRDSVARSARGPGEEHVKKTIIQEEFADSIEELEARVNALLDESTGGDPPGAPQLATPAAAAAAPKQAAGAPAPQPAASAATTTQPVTAHPDSSHTVCFIPGLSLRDEAARVRALASQRDAALAAELAAVSDGDYVAAAASKNDVDETGEAIEDARVAIEARARRAKERVATVR